MSLILSNNIVLTLGPLPVDTHDHFDELGHIPEIIIIA
jgi:hypothetical protein